MRYITSPLLSIDPLALASLSRLVYRVAAVNIVQHETPNSTRAIAGLQISTPTKRFAFRQISGILDHNCYHRVVCVLPRRIDLPLLHHLPAHEQCSYRVSAW